MFTLGRYVVAFTSLGIAFAGLGCGGDAVNDGGANEVITTLTLTLTPEAGGAPIVAGFDDADGDGGNLPIVTGLVLPPGMFDMIVKFENKLKSPPEDLTQEVRDEGIDHQIFFTGTAVNGPASDQPGAPLTHAYADMDSKALPIGITNKLTASVGMGMLTVTLRHMPPVNDVPVKVAGLADNVRTMGLSAIGGSSDVQVTIPVKVE